MSPPLLSPAGSAEGLQALQATKQLPLLEERGRGEVNKNLGVLKLEKTQQALDDLFSSAISLIPTWLNMLKSTRFLTLLLMVAVLIWAWKFSGLTDVQAQIVSVVGGLLGVNFDWVKTIGKKYETPQPLSLPQPGGIRLTAK